VWFALHPARYQNIRVVPVAHAESDILTERPPSLHLCLFDTRSEIPAVTFIVPQVTVACHEAAVVASDLPQGRGGFQGREAVFFSDPVDGIVEICFRCRGLRVFPRGRDLSEGRGAWHQKICQQQDAERVNNFLEMIGVHWDDSSHFREFCHQFSAGTCFSLLLSYSQLRSLRLAIPGIICDEELKGGECAPVL
jgi:hypothetical protein